MPKRKVKKEPDKSPVHVPHNKVGIDEWYPPTKKQFQNIETNSWFDILYHENQFYTDNSFVTVKAPIIPPESRKQQIIANKRKKINKEPVFFSTKKIRIYPNTYQKVILDSWFDAFAKMFNCAITYIRSAIYKKKKLIEIKEARKIVNFFNIRKTLADQKNDIQNLTSPNKIPIHVLDEAIQQAVSNYKTCITNYSEGKIKKFRIREWNHYRLRKIIKVESSFFRNGTFCPNIFGNFKSSEPIENIDRTVTIQYNHDTKKYLLMVPIGTALQEELLNPKIDCGIDLGVRTFATVYSEKGVHSICNRKYKKGERYDTEFNNLLKKIDAIQGILNNGEHESVVAVTKKVNNNIVLNTELKKNNRQKLLKALRKYHARIKNKVKDMHYKVAYELVNTHNNIFIGKLSTLKILSKNNITIGPRTKRMISILSPYQFRQILIYMGYKYGSLVYEVSEYLTTKTCSCCGHLNEVGDSKKYVCKYCKLKMDRDENSARNHLKIGLFEKQRSLELSKQKSKKKMTIKKKNSKTSNKNTSKTARPKDKKLNEKVLKKTVLQKTKKVFTKKSLQNTTKTNNNRVNSKILVEV